MKLSQLSDDGEVAYECDVIRMLHLHCNTHHANFEVEEFGNAPLRRGISPLKNKSNQARVELPEF